MSLLRLSQLWEDIRDRTMFLEMFQEEVLPIALASGQTEDAAWEGYDGWLLEHLNHEAEMHAEGCDE